MIFESERLGKQFDSPSTLLAEASSHTESGAATAVHPLMSIITKIETKRNATNAKQASEPELIPEQTTILAVSCFTLEYKLQMVYAIFRQHRRLSVEFAIF